MEIRTAKISEYSSGGNASVNAKSYRVSLPSSWIKEMGFDKEKNIELVFDGKSISIRHVTPKDIDSFKSTAIRNGHQLIQYEYFDKDTLCSTILCNNTDKTLQVTNHTDNILKTAFGVLKNPTWDDFMEFIRERCVPETRENVEEILKELDLIEFDVIKIVEKTKGIMAEDEQWLKITAL